MPFKRRRAKGRRQQLTTEAAHLLLTGHDYFRSWLNGRVWRSEAHRDVLAELWKQHRANLMAAHDAKYPDCRPWAYWEFDAREPMPDEDRGLWSLYDCRRLLSELNGIAPKQNGASN